MKRSCYLNYRAGIKIRRLLNQSHNSGVMIPRLREYIEFMIKNEAEFHSEEWMENVLKNLGQIVIETPTKHLRFDKFSQTMWKWKEYPLKNVVSIVEETGKDKRWDEPHHVDFSEKDNITMDFKEKGRTGLLRKATASTDLFGWMELEFDEYLNGNPTGEKIYVSYDSQLKTRHLGTFEQTRSRAGEVFFK